MDVQDIIFIFVAVMVVAWTIVTLVVYLSRMITANKKPSQKSVPTPTIDGYALQFTLEKELESLSVEILRLEVELKELTGEQTVEQKTQFASIAAELVIKRARRTYLHKQIRRLKLQG